MSRLNEAFETKKLEQGEVKFSKSSPTDSFCIKMAGIIANARQVTVQDIFKEIEVQIEKVKEIAAKAPTIYHTIVDNLYEGELFTMFEKLNIPVEGAPQFSKITFRKLTEYVRGEHSRFFPLRNFIEKRPHANPAYYYTDDPHDPDTKKSRWASVKTA